VKNAGKPFMRHYWTGNFVAAGAGFFIGRDFDPVKVGVDTSGRAGRQRADR
jgi:hypothetical protein